MHTRIHRWRSLPLAAAVLLFAACTDQPLAPIIPPIDPGAGGMARLACTVDVRQSTLACAPASAAGGPLLAKMVGGQEMYVRLAATRVAYDAVAGEFELDVTVQNLLRQSIGTEDGWSTEGVKVFFPTDPAVVEGSGSVSVHNPDGTEFFTAAGQPYFHYAEILSPYRISAPRTWVFAVDPTVDSFSFSVYVFAPVADEMMTLLDRVWTGAGGSAWEADASWQGGEAPDSTSVVAIPADSLLGGAVHPVLSADAVVTHLRVGTGSTLGLQGHTLEVRGNLDAIGAVQQGTVVLSGAGAMIGGTVPALRVTGGAVLQSPVRASAAVSVSDGSLRVADRALSIQIP